MVVSTDDRSEWLYMKGGMVYGPISGQDLRQRIHSGELGSDIQAAADGGPFRPLGEIPSLLAEVARAEARLRVESEAAGRRKSQQRKRWMLIGGGGGLLALAAAGAIGAVVWLEDSGWFGPDLGALAIEASLPTIRLQVVQEGEEEFLEYEETVDAGSARKAGAAAGVRKPVERRQARTVADSDGLATESHYDPVAIQTVIRREQHTLHPCLREEVGRNPSFRGEVPFSFVIGNDGRVVQLWMDRGDLKNSPLQGCLQERIRSWRFPSFEGERPSVSHAFRVGG